MKTKNEPSGWLDGKTGDPEFRRLYAREEAIEAFLSRVDQEMERLGITRTEMARRMGCSPANVTQVMRRTANLTAATMVDLAGALGQAVAFVLSPRVAEGYQFNSSDFQTALRVPGAPIEGLNFGTYDTAPFHGAPEWQTLGRTLGNPDAMRTEVAGEKLAA